ncbi:MAG TPA: RluA family pseudouridine synthase [Aliidongia sp.]|nr:RluA family pseudouridine synthase [Aliidongia sp.]
MSQPADVQTTELTVGETDAGERLDRLIAARLATLSRSRVKALIEDRRVTADGVTIANPSFRVKPGQRLSVSVPPPVEDRPEPQPIALDIRYEDEELLVLDKPAGMVVHPAPGNPDLTLVNALLAHCGDSFAGIGGVKRPGIVHRIDKDTSGLMVVAKTDRAHASLSAGFAGRTIERAYWAVVWGTPSPREGEIDAPIGRSPTNRKKMAVVASGKPARTLYKVVRPLGLAASLVECRLKTGRTHQIRVHMTEQGHPLVGDPVYGRSRPARIKGLDSAQAAALAAFPRQALHAWLLGFPHPVTGEYLRFESALPADLAELIGSLE